MGNRHRIGHAPCLHPEIYYRPDHIDLQSVVEQPIACGTHIMSSRGRHLVEPTARADREASAQPQPRRS